MTITTTGNFVRIFAIVISGEVESVENGDWLRVFPIPVPLFQLAVFRFLTVAKLTCLAIPQRQIDPQIPPELTRTRPGLLFFIRQPAVGNWRDE